MRLNIVYYNASGLNLCAILESLFRMLLGRKLTKGKVDADAIAATNRFGYEVELEKLTYVLSEKRSYFNHPRDVIVAKEIAPSTNAAIAETIF